MLPSTFCSVRWWNAGAAIAHQLPAGKWRRQRRALSTGWPAACLLVVVSCCSLCGLLSLLGLPDGCRGMRSCSGSSGGAHCTSLFLAWRHGCHCCHVSRKPWASCLEGLAGNQGDGAPARRQRCHWQSP